MSGERVDEGDFNYVKRYIRNYWDKYIIEPEIKKLAGIDAAVHNLVHQLLIYGEPDSGKQYLSFHQESKLHHQELIDAVKYEIKPGFFTSLFIPFNLDMIRDYLKRVFDKIPI